ncbi:MAG: ABC transporter ATP-binding protein [Limnochordia bacterium]|jgi:branched-chain amino acid transport system ATP-binding protein|nr:ABC transporter ATP-binding protein [Bacillota bacterium]HOB07914.1 ABC transporter ATP-binding protein [Limnochordia bacterium]NLH31207.1 ABC transporter ATP-binding protein [Bacillota bacterium]HPT93445.1 ABC transporter ATP-binding protein [Limnochordia bacterium]HPZ29933.1 ABC transporter ATP-binding protein [Limnochordia bacterium]
MELLKVQDLDVYYGGIHALKQVSFTINAGEIVTLIGANGAGKSTTLRAVSGLVPTSSGSVEFKGVDITNMPAHKIAGLKLTHVPEGRRVFANLSVEVNLQLGAYLRKDKAQVQEDLERVYTLFPRLAERRRQLAGSLSGGEQQMLAMGRGLMANPELMLLDEPSMGLAPLLVREIFRVIEEINRSGTTILLVEQNAKMALNVANRAYVLENGAVKLSGTAAELLQDERVRKAYLGG